MFYLLGFCLSAISQVDSTALNNVFGKKGTVQGMVYRITYPRSDLKVKVNEFSVAPGLALTSWIGILSMGNESMMMGDLVLLGYGRSCGGGEACFFRIINNSDSQPSYK